MRSFSSRPSLVSLAVLALSVGCVAQQEAYKPLPLPCGPGAYTKKQLQEERLRWCRSLTTEAYQQFGRKNPAWDEGALKLFEEYGRYRADRGDAAGLLKVGEPVVKAGCDDPLVLYIVAEAMWEKGRPGEAEPLAVQAVEGFKKIPYSKVIAWDAPVTLLEAAHRLGKLNEANEAQELSLRWLAEASAEPAAKLPNHRHLWRWLHFRLNQDYQYRLRREAYAALQTEPKADPWLVDMVGGNYYVKEGWKARGPGFAGTVTEADEKTFQEDLGKAHSCLTRAWRLHPEYPEAATAMIEVAMASAAGVEGETRKWFDRAVAAQFDWPEAYGQYAWSLRPRWAGSLAALMAFGEECSATARFDTEVPWQYLATLYAACNEEHATRVWEQPGVYDRAARVCEGYANALGEFPERVRTWRSRNAALAWRAGRYEQAKNLMYALRPNVEKSYFEEFNVSLPWVWGQVMCMTCPEGERVRHAEQLYQAGRHEEALQAFGPLAELLGAPESQVYLRGRMDSLTKEIAFARGEWVPLQPGADFIGWQSLWGQWGLSEDGALLSVTNSRNLLACLMRAGDAFEVAGSIELPDNNLATAGLAVGLDLAGSPYWSALQISARDHKAHWCHNFASDEGVSIPPAKLYEVRVRVWKQHAAAYVNGARCFSRGGLYTAMATEPGVLVGFAGAEYEGGVKYRSFRIRKLTAEPDNPPTLQPEQ